MTKEPENLTPEMLREWAADCFSALGTLTRGQAEYVMQFADAWEQNLTSAEHRSDQDTEGMG